MNKKNTKLLLLFLCSFTFLGFSQTRLEKKKITKNYNISKLKSLSKKFSSDFYKEKQEAVKLARQKGWKIKYTDANGSHHELMKVTKEGRPVYYKTFNTDAGISTRTNWLHNNGSLGLNLEGQGMTAYIWDQGIARSTHQEYRDSGGQSRYSVGDDSDELSDHAAHVTGTIIASGVDLRAKGMAPQAKGIGYDWGNDENEIVEAAAEGMLLSNHSYGWSMETIEDWKIGAYIEESMEMDEVLYNAPYYLQVEVAGNYGNDDISNEDPLFTNSSYDKLTKWATAKNNLVVANAKDAIIDTESGELLSVEIHVDSSEGPTDDLRIKPDITGNGTLLFSTYEHSDTAYDILSGTSMSAPNVTGSLLLLQQQYNEMYGSFMLGATLKGLALHTADDAGDNGPDAIWGWGLLNAKKAAETIRDKGVFAEIEELELPQGETYTIKVEADGNSPFLASISWRDIPGTPNTGSANNLRKVLVNDLDIRVSKGSKTFYPWKLTNVDSNEKGDNKADPFERVDVGEESGIYIITVSHKGALVGVSQKFSLIITGAVIYNDEEPPTSPSDLAASNTTASTTDLSWSASTDNEGVVEYHIHVFKGGLVPELLPTIVTSQTSYQITDLLPGTPYTFFARAKDVSGNSSVNSNTVSITTNRDNTAPTAPSNLRTENINFDTVSLFWDGSFDSEGPVTYDIYQAGVRGGPIVAGFEGTSYKIVDLTPNTPYIFWVRARDLANNFSSISNKVGFVTSNKLNQGFFETGWDGWTKGGSDSYRYSRLNTRCYERDFAIILRDGSGKASSMTLSGVDASPYSHIKIDFFFYVHNMERREQLVVRFSDGNRWWNIKRYKTGIDIDNNHFYRATLIVDATKYNFTNNTSIRLQNRASDNTDHIYIDKVTISGIYEPTTESNSLITVGKNITHENTTMQGHFTDDIIVYPNPAADILKLNPDYELHSYSIVDLKGKEISNGIISDNTIDVHTLKNGIYILRLSDKEETLVQKFIKN